MRRRVIPAVAIALPAVVGFVGYLLSRDPRRYPLSKGSWAVIATKGDEMVLVQDASSEDVVPMLWNQVTISCNMPCSMSARP